MNDLAHFTRHAFERIAERTTLTCEELARILDRKLTINTGSKPGLNKVHLLFYSVCDDDFFVAIQDELTGTVITVLPLDYHANLAWDIPEEYCAQAKALYLNAPVKNEEPAAKSTVFYVSARFLDDNGLQKTKVIKKVESLGYNNEISALMRDQAFFDQIECFAKEKNIDYKMVFALSIKHGKKGAPIGVDLQDVHNLYRATQWRKELGYE